MSVINEIKTDLLETTTFKTIAETLVEINALKIKKNHHQFLKNQHFYNEITAVYHLVKLSAARRNIKIAPDKKRPTLSQPALFVALTSNSRFYGALNNKVMNQFYKETKKTAGDRWVVGQSGADYLSLEEKGFAYQPWKFKKDSPSEPEIDQLIMTSQKYERVVVFYPKFLTILTQEAQALDITQSAPKILPKNGLVENLFEPELSKILLFFEEQIRSLLFKRVLLETDLSRTAARLITMNETSARSDNLIRKKRAELNKALRLDSNSRLLEAFSGRRLWKGF